MSDFLRPMDYSLLGSSAHGDSPGKNTGVAISFSRGSFLPRDWTQVSYIAGRFFTTEPPGKPSSEEEKTKFFSDMLSYFSYFFLMPSFDFYVSATS